MIIATLKSFGTEVERKEFPSDREMRAHILRAWLPRLTAGYTIEITRKPDA